MICLVVSEIKVEIFQCSWPVYEIASDSLSLGEFGREGQKLLRLCETTETVWEMVSGWTDRDMHGMVCSFSNLLQLHRETQKVEVIYTAQ